MQNGEAKTDIRDNDTSVTRGSVTKKTERLDSYEFARTQMPFEFPSQGVLRTSIDYWTPKRITAVIYLDNGSWCGFWKFSCSWQFCWISLRKKQTGLLYCLLRKNAKVGRNNTYAWELPKAAVAVKKWKDDDKYDCVYLS